MGGVCGEGSEAWLLGVTGPFSRQYFKYEFPEGVDSVIVKVTSVMAFPCSVISIQDILVGLGVGASCPRCPRRLAGLTAPLPPPVPRLRLGQQRGLHRDVPDHDEEGGHHCAGGRGAALPPAPAWRGLRQQRSSLSGGPPREPWLTPVSHPPGRPPQKKDFPSHSFYVVVVVKTEDEACGGALPYYPLSKGASPGTPGVVEAQSGERSSTH